MSLLSCLSVGFPLTDVTWQRWHVDVASLVVVHVGLKRLWMAPELSGVQCTVLTLLQGIATVDTWQEHIEKRRQGRKTGSSSLVAVVTANVWNRTELLLQSLTANRDAFEVLVRATVLVTLVLQLPLDAARPSCLQSGASIVVGMALQQAQHAVGQKEDTPK
jgi:hypothetical protein